MFLFSSNSEVDVTYYWNFGDGTTSEEADPMHSFMAEGDYTVTLQISIGGTLDFETTQLIRVFVCGDILIDERDGQEYTTVWIGNNCWMGENLNVGQRGTFSSDNGIIEKFCYNNWEPNCDTYGGLYYQNELMNYEYAEGTRGICPCGWHVPSENEWQDLEIALEMPIEDLEEWGGLRGTDQGDRLKTVADCTGGINCGVSGFNALLAGSYEILNLGVSGYVGLEMTGQFATSSFYDENPYMRFVSSESSKLWIITPVYSITSVRCIKDKN